MDKDRDWMILRMLTKSSSSEISDSDVEFFRENPDLLDEVSAPVFIHRFFLWLGALLGVALVGVSKILKYSESLAFLPQGFGEFLNDVVFETGVALIGAAVTAYLLGILLNKQQYNAARLRSEIRRRIAELEAETE